jgi:glycosyltransferase involved in cell wall biosynthesis
LDANNEWEDRLAKLPNVRLLGRYENFSDIPAEQYFAFLYTTQYDGLPNVLLEALASGLPAVAPDVGGIREIVNDDTGWLVKDNTDVEAYMAALREMQRDVEEVEKRWCRARDLLLARHTEENFREALFAAYGWL